MKGNVFLFIVILLGTVLSRAEVPEGKMVSHFDNPDYGGTVSASLVPETTADYWITATPESGYEFLYWADGETTNPRKMTFTDEERQARVTKKYYAVFAKTADIHVAKGQVTVSVVDMPSKTYSLSVAPLASAPCATLRQWTNGSTSNPVEYVEESGTMAPDMIIRELLYQRHDAANCYIQATPLTCGYTITAVPAPGYQFVKWTDDPSITSLTRTVAHSPQTYTAVFAQGVAVVEDQSFETIQNAIDNSGGQEVIILTDVVENITISSPVVIAGNGHEIGDITILNGGKLILSTALEANNLYLNATTGASSQLVNPALLTYAHAHIDIQLESNNTVASPDKWYAFAVPFDVDLQTGVHRASAPTTDLIYETDYLVWEYDGDLRAETGNGWIIMGGGTLSAGNFYMIGIDGTENKWRFTKTTNSTLSSVDWLTLHEFPSASITERGWNAVANPTLHFVDAAVQSGIYIAQVYENGADEANYKVKNLTAQSFVMASPFFIQTAGNDVLSFSSATHNDALLTPKRLDVPNFYSLHLGTLNNGEFSEYDVVYGTASADASNGYVIGKDVVKMLGEKSSSRTYPYPYMYINAYGLKLCAHDAPINAGNIEYHISVYAPESGTYLFRAAEGELLKNDMVVWSFSNGDCQMLLTKGINDGLIYRIKKSTPVATDLSEEAAAESPIKFIRENQLMIKVNGRLYNVQGERLE